MYAPGQIRCSPCDQSCGLPDADKRDTLNLIEPNSVNGGSPMKTIQHIEFNGGSREERLPGFDPAFPYISTRAELDCYPEPVVPWHWHRSVELFYVQSGCLEYAVPGGTRVFPAGSGGFVNANVLHASRFQPGPERNIQLLHLFDPALLAGAQGSRIEARYILPLTSAPDVELLPLFPEDPDQAALLDQIAAAFTLDEDAWGWELELRAALSRIWLELVRLARPAMGEASDGQRDETLKSLLIYLWEHLQEPLTVDELARSCHISRRTCFRLFRERLRTTPTAYLQGCRLQRACQLLTGSTASVTQIACACGLGSSSYFGKLFRQAYHCSPTEYRRRWHDRTKNGRE